MKYLSVCSGIEAASVAWHPLGWVPLAFSEIDKFPRKVLEHHYPDVPLHGDFTVLREQDWIKDADILVGGTPCQAFSVAGLRNSLEDDRGNLTLEFVRLADAIDNLRSDGNGTIIVWENVPGVLSVKDNAFGCFLGALAGNDDPLVPTGGKWTNAGMVVGPKRSVAWRVLDAQYFGVAQRRRRVFVVASARDEFDPAEVLFEREGLRRDSPPSREKGQGVAPTVTGGPPFSRTGNDRVEADAVIAARMVAFGEYTDDGTASAMKARDWKDATDLVAFHVNAMPDQMNFSTDTTASLTTSQHAGVAQPIATSFYANEGSHGMGDNTEVSVTLKAHPKTSNLAAVAQSMSVRRLTPRECERLQGFPDDYTAIPGAADGPRYKALGNSMAVPVMAWIGRRIKNNLP
jgi:DNA (cytosine-5)-methyltransferase 1